MDVLIGATGFIGSNYLRRHQGTLGMSREQIEDTDSKIECQTLVVAAPSAEKWRANLEPFQDKQECESLVSLIWKKFSPEELILFSSVDVYADTTLADEETGIFSDSPYGSNRLMVSQKLGSTFDNVTVGRLPGLYGPGLKKTCFMTYETEDLTNSRG